ncbi:MAG: GAF domain-containing protein [Anaerolineae bacterium]|nr:GAF domain-containing protein [Anaerolineae bacterium]
MSQKISAQSRESIGIVERLTEQNQRLAEEVKRRIDQLAAINSVATVVGQSLDLEVTLQSALSAVMDVINVEATGISLIDEVNKELVLRAQRGWKRDFVTMGMRMPMGHGLSWHVIEHDELVVTGDVSADSRIKHQAFQEEGVQAQALAPMHARGRVIGILSALSYEPYIFAEEELSVLCAIADQVGMALDNACLFSDVVSKENRFRAILDCTADTILAVDMDCNICSFNHTAESLFGLEADHVLGCRFDRLRLPEPLVRGLSEAIERKDQTSLAFEFACEVPAGEHILSCSISPVLDAAGMSQGWVAVMGDITHLRALDQLKTQVIQTAAHDLRSPLAATRGAISLLHDAFGKPDERQEKVFRVAFEGLKQTHQLVDNLLNIERIEAGVMLDSHVELGRLAKRVIKDQRATATRREQKLIIDVPSRLPTVRGSDIWLERAIANYVGNAIKYTSRGGTVRLVVWREHDEVLLEVEDDGPGIPLDAQGRLFERFYRVPQSAENDVMQGSGLGLAIVKLIIAQHGGRVYVRSQPGQGSTFGFALPVMNIIEAKSS